MPNIKLYLSLFLVLLVTGCAHPITMNPELSALRTENTAKSKVIAGYYLSPAAKAAQIETKGGGGDFVTYFPYKDTEAALKTILSNKFSKVYSLNHQTDDPLIKTKNIKFIFTPKITTDSHSSSALTWPPTDFTVILTCTAYSEDGKKVWEKSVTGTGHAEYSEFKSDFSLSAKKASQNAFKLMVNEILSAKEFK